MYAQKKEVQLQGTVLSNTKRLANIHIINLNSKNGTISNENGEFLMKVSLNDTLYISSINYEKIKIGVTPLMIKTKQVFIVTNPKTYPLKEVIVRNHDLTENLYYDVLNKPKDTIPPMNVNSEYFKNLDFTGVKFKSDAMSSNRPPDVEHLVNPIMGGSPAATLPDYHLIAKYKLRKRLKLQKDFPTKIVNELGKDYFIDKLQIPSESIHHFLSYCESKNIVQLYHENNLLEVIKILGEEANTYKALKKEE